MKNDCLFCAIAAGEIPSNKVYEDELCYAFRDIAPQAPTHFLVIPKVHIASVSGINAENSAVVAHIFEVIAKVTKEMGIESYRVVSNIGEQAGQSVFHLHFHVLAGGAILGAVFMATDYSTSPMTVRGGVIYAVGIGVITMCIRLWGAYPEGMSFAILIMNACVPLINKYVKPKRFGVK